MSEDSTPRNSIDLAAARANLERAGGKRLWQSIEELSDTKDFRNFLHNEFPANEQTKELKDAGINRRDVMKLMAASAAMAGLSACTKLPTEKIVPYVRPPEEIIPGRPLFYATSMPQAGVAVGLLVESNMGRPTKIEGNTEHPGSQGGTDVFAQGSVLDLYDPDRLRTVLHEGSLSDWATFSAVVNNQRVNFGGKGTGLRILTGTVTSPTLGAQLKKILTALPEAKWHQYEPGGGDSVREGTRLAFGKPMNAVYHFEQADIVVSLDSDFLTTGPGHTRYTRDFSRRHDLAEGPSSKVNRLYVVEPMPTSTGAMADHRWPLRATEVEGFARQLAAAVGVSIPGGASAGSKIPADAVAAIGRDLAAHRGTSLVIAGDHQPAFVHALAHAMNAALGNSGKTVTYTESIEANPVNQLDSIRDLVNDLNAGKVEFLVILGVNPVYTAPADLNFGSAILKAKTRVYSGQLTDETGTLCHWQAPAAHYLESWSDGRAYDGTVSITQPLIAPLYEGHSAHEILALLTDESGKSGHDIVRDYWQGQRSEKGAAYEAFWETSLHDGVMAGTALPGAAATLRSDFTQQAAQAQSASTGLEIVFRPDPTIGDGQYSNNGWLQETPKTITRLTWDNAAMISPATAQQLGLTNSDYVTLQVNGRQAKAGVLIVPGHADNSVTAHLGYGRSHGGNVAKGAGFNANLLRTTTAAWMATGLQISKTGDDYPLASVQHQFSIDFEGHPADFASETAFRRDLVQIGTLADFQKNPSFAQNESNQIDYHGPSLYPNFKYEGYSWGMSIDLNRCIGCNACVTACVAENNIAVVGKDQVARGRSMHWIRIDTYFRGDLDNPEVYYEPLPCMQCENAPCEYVCPVGATTHSPEGLNDMTYNRCVGTRYCSNNCPYKVRRFNFFLYSDYDTPSLFGVRNPNVSVRSRGVMEKCTYCVQRINAAKIRSEVENNRTIADGEIITACQQACPAEAIVFGNINDPNSRVSKLKAQTRNYGLLVDLNTRPRTTYLARVRNPNPEIRG